MPAHRRQSEPRVVRHALCAATFPAEYEQRLEPSQCRIMLYAQYHFGLLYDGKHFSDLVLYWAAAEYFCVSISA